MRPSSDTFRVFRGNLPPFVNFVVILDLFPQVSAAGIVAGLEGGEEL